MIGTAEYIWLDGYEEQNLRSKTKIININGEANLKDFEEWGFDGSSTKQAEGHESDCILRPVNFVHDPIRGEGSYLVLCEVYNADGTTAHTSNNRARLRHILNNGGEDQEAWIGFEQEYTFFKDGKPLGWPESGEPKPQGPYYCSVGNSVAFGRNIAEEHMAACIDAGIIFYGINAEVMPGQWEYQIGYRGIEGEPADLLNISDHRLLAKWLLLRISEEYGIDVDYSNKPMKGDWNGAGCHTNFSTKFTRDQEFGMQAINSAIEKLSTKHKEHIALYGDKLNERLTGEHETCSIDEFKSGVAHRGASIRIPQNVQNKGYGYFEDRRPGANSCPYLVSARILATIADINDEILVKGLSLV